MILAEDARIPVEGGGAGRGRGAGPGGGGRAAVRPEYADLVSADDLVRFDQFVRTGGTVVCLGGASTFAIAQFKLPVKNVVAGLRPEEYFLRGSLVEVTTDPTHPVMAGMPAKAAVFVDGSPVFETLEGFTGRVLAKYQDTGSPLLSGYLIGEKYLQGKAAALDVQVDRGHVVLLGFRPQWRGQPFGTLRVLFNAALFASRIVSRDDGSVDCVSDCEDERIQKRGHDHAPDCNHARLRAGGRRIGRRAGAAVSHLPDRRRADLAQAGRLAGHFAGRQVGRLHDSRDELGRERLRDRDLARRHAVWHDASAHQRPQVEHMHLPGRRTERSSRSVRIARTSGRSI